MGVEVKKGSDETALYSAKGKIQTYSSYFLKRIDTISVDIEIDSKTSKGKTNEQSPYQRERMESNYYRFEVDHL